MRTGLDAPSRAPVRTGWTLLSNHGHVLVCVADDPDVRLRDLAERVGITERSAFALVSDLINGGFVDRARIGRRNRYTVNFETTLGEQIETSASVGDLLRAISSSVVSARDGSAEQP